MSATGTVSRLGDFSRQFTAALASAVIVDFIVFCQFASKQEREDWLMKFLLPYYFTASVVKTRKRSASREVFLSSVEVEIPEVTGQSAPLVATVKHPGYTQTYSEAFDRSYHGFNGNFYSNLRGKPRLQELAWGRHASKVGGLPKVGQEVVEGLLVQWSDVPDVKEGDIFGERVRTWLHSDQDRFREAAIRSVDGLIAVDGALMRPCAEPRIGFTVRTGIPESPFIVDTPEHEGRTWVRNDPRMYDPTRESFFRLTDNERAQAWYAEFGGHDNSTAIQVEIYEPDYFEFDRTTDLYLRLTSAFVEGVTSELGGKSDEFVDAWKTVRSWTKLDPDRMTQKMVVAQVGDLVRGMEPSYLRDQLGRAVSDWSVEYHLEANVRQRQDSGPRL
jgi:hypothetical protein